ncbi:MAG: transporter substrate-binding domain-containing protein [Oscillospiraceae bacterium]|nr:transporter substrate-binding domain-containing protein [Oscillospiraceae bacterium]
MKKSFFQWISLFLILGICIPLCGCGNDSGSYGVKTVQTLVEQDYSLAFRNNDPTAYYVIGAIQKLDQEGKVDELAVKWFGQRIISFPQADIRLEELDPTEYREFIIGLDINSFPLAYSSNGQYWGFDVELAVAVCEVLGWHINMQPIEKENVYIELSSGNIDCAWGGLALDPDEVDRRIYARYGPYVYNDIVVAVRSNSYTMSKAMLTGKKMVMPSTPEAMDALNTDQKLIKRLGQITRLAGGTTECFSQLYAGKCDAVLTDSTALYYFNSH